MNPDVLMAPWTENEVRSLELRQADKSLHPYTCFLCNAVLAPRMEGWYCHVCGGIVQTWAHQVDARPE